MGNGTGSRGTFAPPVGNPRVAHAAPARRCECCGASLYAANVRKNSSAVIRERRHAQSPSSSTLQSCREKYTDHVPSSSSLTRHTSAGSTVFLLPAIRTEKRICTSQNCGTRRSSNTQCCDATWKLSDTSSKRSFSTADEAFQR